MGVTFFGRHFMIRQVKKGQQLVVEWHCFHIWSSGTDDQSEWEPLETENLHTVGIVPCLSTDRRFKRSFAAKADEKRHDYWSERIPDYVPEGTLERTELGDLGGRLRMSIFPEGWDHLELARKRLIFDELLTLQLAMLGNRREWQSIPAQALDVSDEFWTNLFRRSFHMH
jgi:ATP-dependent DNA helicase RecG